MKDEIRNYILELLYDIAAADTQLVLLIMLLVITVIVIDAVSAAARMKREDSGLTQESTAVSIDGTESLPVKNYVSEIQGLAGKPDALIVENGYFIPVERKPLAKKIRDRYVAQLLVYMRLVEEFEGKKPPYGYLILGQNCRRVKIHNSEEKQQWLQGMLDEMKAILHEERAAIPAPHPKKCKKCVVRHGCSTFIEQDELVAIGNAAQTA